MIEVNGFSLSLLLAAAGIAVTHAILGPDHYLPFLMLAKARGWSRARTLLVTAICGLGHVLSSMALGVVGLGIGAGLGWVERIEGQRGDWAAWALVWFGLAYTLWGVRKALKRRQGLDPHSHHHGHVHIHTGGGHEHHHAAEVDRHDSASTFWALFVVFVLGPCEPLIPLFVLPASRGDWGLAALTGGVFGVVTVASMLVLVLIGHAGLSRLPLGPMARWAHAMAGAVVMGSGLAVIYLGL